MVSTCLPQSSEKWNITGGLRSGWSHNWNRFSQDPNYSLDHPLSQMRREQVQPWKKRTGMSCSQGTLKASVFYQISTPAISTSSLCWHSFCILKTASFSIIYWICYYLIFNKKSLQKAVLSEVQVLGIKLSFAHLYLLSYSWVPRDLFK